MSTATWLPGLLETIDSKKLARFRADPAKVRVSVRQVQDGYRVTVESRIIDSKFWNTDRDPAVAVDSALGAADLCGMDGIDLGMEWAYLHPMRAT